MKIDGRTDDNRVCFRYYIDGVGRSYICADLRSGVGNNVGSYTLQMGFGSLLAFLGSEEVLEEMPKRVREWAEAHDDDISLLKEEIETEGNQLISD